MAYGGIMGKGLPGNVLKSQVVSGHDPLYTQVNINLSTKNEGDIITLPEDGKSVEFYVAKKDYESGLNGTGRVLLVRKDAWPTYMVWNSSGVNTYANSTVDTWLNGDYKAKFPQEIQTAMGTTKFDYTPGGGNNTVGQLERAIFILSLTELGKSSTYANVEGSALPAEFLSTGFGCSTRTPETLATSSFFIVNVGGSVTGNAAHLQTRFNPIFTLPNTFTYTYYADSAGNAYEEQAYSDASYQFVNQAGVVMPIAQIETGSYVGTGGFTEGTTPTLTFKMVPQIVYIADATDPPGGITTGLYGAGPLINGAKYGSSYMLVNLSRTTELHLTWSGNTLSFYADSTTPGQSLNAAGTTYRYVAIS